MSKQERDYHELRAMLDTLPPGDKVSVQIAYGQLKQAVLDLKEHGRAALALVNAELVAFGKFL